MIFGVKPKFESHIKILSFLLPSLFSFVMRLMNCLKKKKFIVYVSIAEEDGHKKYNFILLLQFLHLCHACKKLNQHHISHKRVEGKTVYHVLREEMFPSVRSKWVRVSFSFREGSSWFMDHHIIQPFFKCIFFF